MAAEIPTVPVEDSVAKIGDELAVGEDLEFQRRWWRFERAIWIFFAVIVVLDMCGAFGRGPLADAHKRSTSGALDLRYERVERFSTPSILTIQVAPQAVHSGKVQLWVSNSVVKQLGNQRIIPQPASSTNNDGGVLYTFPTLPGSRPASVEFALQPAERGSSSLTIRLVSPDGLPHPEDSITAAVFVMP